VWENEAREGREEREEMDGRGKGKTRRFEPSSETPRASRAWFEKDSSLAGSSREFFELLVKEGWSSEARNQ